MNPTRRAQVLPEKGGWWQWDCGWSGCIAGEQERTQAAAIDAVTRHSHRHLAFGFRLATNGALKEGRHRL
jgi:hypothetical protein